MSTPRFFAEPQPEFYTLGGALNPTAPSYVPRDADGQLLEALTRGQYCYVLTPRQMGKSSLMVRAATQLASTGRQAVIIDLTRIGAQTTAAEWYAGHVWRIRDQLALDIDVDGWWARHAHLSPVQRFTGFIEDIAGTLRNSATIFIDEIDTTLSLPFSDDYFAAIRALYNARATTPALSKVTFVLLGVASPSDLIKDATRTPFNIGVRISLTDFTVSEAEPLQSALSPDRRVASALLNQILLWTAGHPYLTQKSCRSVAEVTRSEKLDRISAGTIVDEVVKRLFFSDSGRNTDSNLAFVRDRLLESPQRSSLLNLYSSIRHGQTVVDDELDPVRVALKLSGLIKVGASGLLRVRNLIYETVFDDVWIGKAVENPSSKLADRASPGLRDMLGGLLRPSTSRRAPTGTYDYDVYLGYSHRDRSWVEAVLVPALESFALRVFKEDTDIQPGQSWTRALEAAMSRSRNFVLVLTPDYLAGRYSEFEIQRALKLQDESKERLMIPLLLRSVDIPAFLLGFTYLDFTDQSRWTDQLIRLGETLGADIPAPADRRLPTISLTKKEYDTTAVRAMLNELDNDDVTALAFDCFRPVFERFKTNTPKKLRIQRVLEYGEQHEQLDRLLDYLARMHPREYQRFADRLERR
jgi:hypothetical protein